MSQYFPTEAECGRHTIFPGVHIKTSACEKMMVSIVDLEPNSVVEEHAHPHEQVLVVLTGRVRMKIGGETYELGPREVAHMPPNVPHSLQALEDTEVLSAKGIVGGVGHRI